MSPYQTRRKSRFKARHSDFRSGLQTTAPIQGPGAAAFSTFYDARVDTGACKRRPGRVRLAQITPTIYCGDFDGTNDTLNGYQPCTFGPKFTIECLVNADSVASGNYTILGGGGASSGLVVKHTSSNGGTVQVDLVSAAGACSTTVAGIGAGVLLAIMFTRNGAACTLYVNGTIGTQTHPSATENLSVQGGATPSTVFRVGSNNGADFYDGKIDFLRGFNYVKTSQRDGWSRLLNPWARGVLFDYVFEADAVGDVQDRSPFGNHLAVGSNPPTMNTIATLANNPAPIQAICGNKARTSARQIVVVAGGRQYEGTLS